MDEKALEEQACREILREAKRGAERSKDLGTEAWEKAHIPKTNKRFLRNTILSTLSGRRGPSRNRHPEMGSEEKAEPKAETFSRSVETRATWKSHTQEASKLVKVEEKKPRVKSARVSRRVSDSGSDSYRSVETRASWKAQFPGSSAKLSSDSAGAKSSGDISDSPARAKKAKRTPAGKRRPVTVTLANSSVPGAVRARSSNARNRSSAGSSSPEASSSETASASASASPPHLLPRRNSKRKITPRIRHSPPPQEPRRPRAQKSSPSTATTGSTKPQKIVRSAAAPARPSSFSRQNHISAMTASGSASLSGQFHNSAALVYDSDVSLSDDDSDGNELLMRRDEMLSGASIDISPDFESIYGPASGGIGPGTSSGRPLLMQQQQHFNRTQYTEAELQEIQQVTRKDHSYCKQ